MRSMLETEYVSHLNKIITPQLGFSYKYDTRGCEREWGKAVAVEDFCGTLIKRPNQKLVLKDLTKAVLLDAEKHLYDLGRECCGLREIEYPLVVKPFALKDERRCRIYETAVRTL